MGLPEVCARILDKIWMLKRHSADLPAISQQIGLQHLPESPKFPDRALVPEHIAA
jgi:hypothetical protein